MTGTDDRIREILEPILASYGLMLWDMEFQKQGPRWLLRIYIDRDPGGVTLGDCEAVSRDLGMALDVEDFIPHAYALEVSSPGLDRTLSKPEHFTRFSGNTIRIKTFEPVNGQKVFRGILLGMVDGVIKIEIANQVVMEVPLSQITKTTLEVDFS